MSPLGSSGGRSARNRTGRTAKERSTIPERAGEVPRRSEPHVDLDETWVDRAVDRVAEQWAWVDWVTVGRWVGIGSYVFFCVLLAVVVCAWWGLL